MGFFLFNPFAVSGTPGAALFQHNTHFTDNTKYNKIYTRLDILVTFLKVLLAYVFPL